MYVVLELSPVGPEYDECEFNDAYIQRTCKAPSRTRTTCGGVMVTYPSRLLWLRPSEIPSNTRGSPMYTHATLNCTSTDGFLIGTVGRSRIVHALAVQSSGGSLPHGQHHQQQHFRAHSDGRTRDMTDYPTVNLNRKLINVRSLRVRKKSKDILELKTHFV